MNLLHIIRIPKNYIRSDFILTYYTFPSFADLEGFHTIQLCENSKDIFSRVLNKNIETILLFKNDANKSLILDI